MVELATSAVLKNYAGSRCSPAAGLARKATKYEIGWGDKDKLSILMQKFKDHDHEWLGRAFGISEKDIKEHIARLKKFDQEIIEKQRKEDLRKEKKLKKAQKLK